jgi:hypothetical protein
MLFLTHTFVMRKKVAPGENVHSVMPIGLGNKGLLTLSESNMTFNLRNMNDQVMAPISGVSGLLVDCGFGTNICPGSGAHICIMSRYVM